VWSISTIPLCYRGTSTKRRPAIRRRLRWVLDQVSDAVGSLSEGRPLVDLILNGHAHCWNISTGDTGHADSISTGRLRRQRF